MVLAERRNDATMMRTLQTERGRLREWTHCDIEAFAALHADREVMWDFARPLDRRESEEKLARYIATFAAHAFGRWAMETRAGEFLGYVGLLPMRDGHPRAPGVEIGWRFRRGVWGQGYATEGAKAALEDGFSRLGLGEIIAYTAPDNLRSQAVMRRAGMSRAPELDFIQDDGWAGWVWRAIAGGGS